MHCSKKAMHSASYCNADFSSLVSFMLHVLFSLFILIPPYKMPQKSPVRPRRTQEAKGWREAC